MVSFSQLPAVKKDTIFGAARNLFGPSYFVTALTDSEVFILSAEINPILLKIYFIHILLTFM